MRRTPITFSLGTVKRLKENSADESMVTHIASSKNHDTNCDDISWSNVHNPVFVQNVYLIEVGDIFFITYLAKAICTVRDYYGGVTRTPLIDVASLRKNVSKHATLQFRTLIQIPGLQRNLLIMPAYALKAEACGGLGASTYRIVIRHLSTASRGEPPDEIARSL